MDGAVEEHDEGDVKRGEAVWRARHVVVDGFMGEDFARRLLAHAVANEAAFGPSQVTSPEERRALDVDSRRSWSFAGPLGPLGEEFEQRLRGQCAELFARLGMVAPPDPILDLGLAAHRDGDYFRSHVDVFAEEKRAFATYDRMVSAVYYVCREPRGFTGGELALHPLFGGGTSEVVAAVNDRLVVFPSYAPHEVLPVSLPGDSFAAARFALNCWIGRARV